jgi:hypothetical protein
VEDELSEAVAHRLLAVSRRRYAVRTCHSRGGFGYLKRQIRGFNKAARGTPFLVLTDLDKSPCPPTLVSEWLDVPMHPNLLLRVAVREVEAWLLADTEAFAKFAGLPISSVPTRPENLDDPKRALIQLVAKSPSRELRADMVPPIGSSRIQGPNYNGRLCRFV